MCETGGGRGEHRERERDRDIASKSECLLLEWKKILMSTVGFSSAPTIIQNGETDKTMRA